MANTTWNSDYKQTLILLSLALGMMVPTHISVLLLEWNVNLLLLIFLHFILISVTIFPCIFTELALGQFSNKGTIKVWDLCPVLRGIGVCSFINFLIFQICYNQRCTYTLFSATFSLISQNYWKSCNGTWAKINCFTFEGNYTQRYFCEKNISKTECDQLRWESSAEQFFYNFIINVNEDSGNLGYLQYRLLFFSLTSICLIFLSNFNGPKSVDKWLIFLVIIPTLQLIILFCIPHTIRLGFQNLKTIFLDPRLPDLSTIEKWVTSVDVYLTSLFVGFGAYTTLATHYSFRSPCHTKLISTAFFTLLLTVMYTITLSDYLAMLRVENKLISIDFFFSGRLKIPEATFFMPSISPFWMVMWLTNMYLLGLRNLIVMMCINVEVLYNSIPKARNYHSLCVLFFCTLIYGGGIILSTGNGYVILTTVETIMEKYLVPFVNTCQSIGICYIYGINRFRKDVDFMLGIRISIFWIICYMFHPILFGSILVYNIKNYFESQLQIPSEWLFLTYNAILWFNPLLVIFFALFYVMKVYRSQFLKIIKPSLDWGPQDPILRKSRHIFGSYDKTEEYIYRHYRLRPIETTGI